VDLLQAIVLGIVQGLTEFLPISSSGHLRIVPAFAGWEDPGAAFTAIIQLGTMAAVVLYFREDLLRIARAWLASLRDPQRRRDLDARVGWYLIIGTIPISIFGLAFSDQIENGARDLYIIGTTLIVLGLVLLVAEKVSRSGATITAGLLLGFDRIAAARFSFLLSIPAVVLSGLFELKGVLDGSVEGAVGAVPTAVATLLAFVSGYASIAFLLRFLTTHTTGVFVAYRVVLGVAVLILAGTHTIS